MSHQKMFPLLSNEPDEGTFNTTMPHKTFNTLMLIQKMLLARFLPFYYRGCKH